MKIPGAWRIENAAHTIRLVGEATSGYRQFLRTGTTPTEAYAAMRELYCRTNGRYNDFMAALSALRHPPRKLAIAKGVLGELDIESIVGIAGNIRRHGYHVFERKLPENMQQTLVEFALHTPAKPLVIAKNETLTQFNFEWLADCLYDRSNIVSAKYDFAQQIIAEQRVVQQLLTDETILAVARAYLGAEPINDLIAMWWSTNYLHGKPSSAAAQNFHFDMDRIKFLKFFFYLSDVGTENGPHCYIRSSHNRKPRALLKDGRIVDEEIFTHYSGDHVVEITGERGTILAADTRGFHKGKPVQSGERLLLQFEFATSLFGTEYQKIKVNEKFGNEFRQFAAQHPRIFVNYDL